LVFFFFSKWAREKERKEGRKKGCTYLPNVISNRRNEGHNEEKAEHENDLIVHHTFNVGLLDRSIAAKSVSHQHATSQYTKKKKKWAITWHSTWFSFHDRWRQRHRTQISCFST
jgi:hypothetical protein